MYLSGLCFITDRGVCKNSYEDMVRKVLQAGVRWVQYRDKNGTQHDIHHNAHTLRKLTRAYDAVLIINDYADIALASDADGVHLGQDDLPLQNARALLGKDKLIGVSTHTVEQAVLAESAGADYIGFGPVFHTETKDAGSPKGIKALRAVRQHVKIPIVAIGGITLGNAQSVFETGADAVAVASAILKGDIRENAKRLLEIIHYQGGQK